MQARVQESTLVILQQWTYKTPCPIREAQMNTVISDPRFDGRFRGRLMQIFLYLTDECNIRCVQCYYKPSLTKRPVEIPTQTAVALLEKFRELGALKVTFLGGEPTLYGKMPGNKPLSFMVDAARRLGFEYIRTVTNGLFDPSLLQNQHLQEIDEITFSIDGDTAEIHNALRGRTTYERSVENLRAAVRLGYNVHVTMCVHRANVGRDSGGTLLLSRAINWAASLGVKSFNLHPLFQMGVARDAWTGETDIDPVEWLEVYRELRSLSDRGVYRIPVRVPLRFVTAAEFERKPGAYGYCSIKLADRLDVHPSGHIHTCALHNSTSVAIANFEEKDQQIRIGWSAKNNELEHYPFKEDEQHPCLVMKGFKNGLQPLCISLKPGQEEFVWKRLHMDEVTL